MSDHQMSGDKESVLITGCSDGGIGGALAHAFRRHDFHVFATARNVDKMASLSDLPDVTLLQLDVTSDEQVAAAAGIVRAATGGRLDYLVNNSACNHFMPMLDESIAEVQALFDTNVFGPLRVVKALAPLVIGARGTIVHISSMSGYLNMPWMGSYAATKRSAEIMAETMRLELEPFGVRVLSLVTGAVATNGLAYFGGFKLPPDSIFRSIEPIIKGRANGAGRPSRVETADEYAAKVMPTILSRRSGIVWAPGLHVWPVKVAVGWLPTWLTDMFLRMGTGIRELSQNLKTKND